MKQTVLVAPRPSSQPRRSPVNLSPAIATAARLGVAAVLVWVLAGPQARAVPSFARQMDAQCIQCHTEFPILTEFGRQFKLSGYTQAQNKSDWLPVAVMLQPSFTHTAKDQAGGAAPGFGENNNWAFSQVSVFYSGRLLGPLAGRLTGPAGAFLTKLGIFSQVTYDGGAKSWSWDNVELRYADAGSVFSQPVTYGVYLNNNPSAQDPWNATPAWGFPFSSSKLAPSPAAATLIDGGLSQEVAGLGTYAMWANLLYLDVGAYRSLGARFQRHVGVDPAGETQIAGAAPYWRVAVVKAVGAGNWELGTFGMSARTYPGRDASAGEDRIIDFGFDSEFQQTVGHHDALATASLIHEHADWNASQALGDASHPSGGLQTLRLTVGDLYDKTFSAMAQYFAVKGTADPLLRADSADGSPTSDGWVLQANYLPFNKSGGPGFWPRSNVKISLQYTLYNRFDGSGRNPRDHNTLYFESWIDF